MRKTVLRFFTIADFEEEETWLRKMHASGWKFVSYVFCFYTFESCQPEDVIYRLDFKNAGQTPDYMQMLADFGWEYIDDCFGFLYFRKPADRVQAEEDGELFSDRESKLDLVTRIVKRRLLPLIVIFFCCVIPNFLRYSLGDEAGLAATVFSVFFGVMFVIYCGLIAYCGIKLRRLRKKFGEEGLL